VVLVVVSLDERTGTISRDVDVICAGKWVEWHRVAEYDVKPEGDIGIIRMGYLYGEYI